MANLGSGSKMIKFLSTMLLLVAGTNVVAQTDGGNSRPGYQWQRFN